MKAVLMSIHPNWCVKIKHIIGQKDENPIYEKSVEIRKTRPKMKTPFKCYIYCTRGYVSPDTDVFAKGWCGYVIGEFVCDEIIKISKKDLQENFRRLTKDIIIPSCLSVQELKDYLGFNDGYGWHISDLVIYEQPKELREFSVFAKNGCPAYLNGVCVEKNHRLSLYFRCENLDCQHKKLTKPPQSWCYVTEKIE